MSQLSLFEENKKSTDILLKIIEEHNRQYAPPSKYVPMTPVLALDDLQAKENAILWIRSALYQHQKSLIPNSSRFLKTLKQEAMLKKAGSPSVWVRAALLTTLR